jgi:(S)-ureidoglycine aminohydrolase
VTRSARRSSAAFPHWDASRAWVQARPIAGFSDTFAQYLVEVDAGGGSDNPESQPEVESLLFVLDGSMALTLGETDHELTPGGYAFIPPGARWTVRNRQDGPLRFHWTRKRYEEAGYPPPPPIVGSDEIVPPLEAAERWASRLIPVDDMRYDMHVNVVSFHPGATIPFTETHVMEHGIYVLQGKGVYRLNQDWVEVQAGDFLWLRAFCPQTCYAGGSDLFRYLLYKDVNRQITLGRR